MSQQPPSKRILLGITGGIAAYKSVELVRLLTGAGYEVVPILTPWATKFVGPLTLEALTGHPVRVETPSGADREGIEHISLIRSAALLLVAPLTANTAAKMAQGLADNFLTTTYLAHTGLTLVCPAMNTAMLQHPATNRNMAQLAQDGVRFCEGSAGILACGEVGSGRMAEPSVILDRVTYELAEKIPNLIGRKVLVSAGPTREDLDPVRFFSNRSSGKMGIQVARAFRDAGASVILVCGPTSEVIPPHQLEVVNVRSAAEMSEAILSRQAQSDIIVMAAAVADYRPERQPQKLKKHNFDGIVRMERTTDILATLGRHKPEGQVLVGFAAESEHVEDNARIKLQAKNLDFIFANDISGSGLGFGSEANHLLALGRNGQRVDLGQAQKQDLANQMVRLIVGIS